MTGTSFKSLKEVGGELVQRAFFGGAYLSFVSFLFLVFPSNETSTPIVSMSFFPVLIIPGMILAHVSYELWMPLVRGAVKGKMLAGFRKIVGDKGKDCCADYYQLRLWRNSYINRTSAEGGYYSRRLVHSMEVRRILIYLFACSMTGIFISVIGVVAYKDLMSVGLTGCALSLFIAMSTLIGTASRYRIIGELIGNAYLDEEDQESKKIIT
jgi:hypothetical protein